MLSSPLSSPLPHPPIILDGVLSILATDDEKSNAKDSYTVKAEAYLSLGSQSTGMGREKLRDVLQKSLPLIESNNDFTGTKGIQTLGPGLLQAQNTLEGRNELVFFKKGTNPCMIFFMSLMAPILGWFARLFSPLFIAGVFLGKACEDFKLFKSPSETWNQTKEAAQDSYAQWIFWFRLISQGLHASTRQTFFPLGQWTVHLRGVNKSDKENDTAKKNSFRVPPMRRVPFSMATFTTLNDLYWFWAPIIIFCFVVFFVAASMGGVRSYSVNPPLDQLDRTSYLCTPPVTPYTLLPGILGELGFQDFFWGAALIGFLFYILLGSYSLASSLAFRPIKSVSAKYKSILSTPKAAQYMVSYRWGNPEGALLARSLSLHLPDTWLDMKYLRSGDFVPEQTFLAAFRAHTLILIIDNEYFSRESCMSELAAVVFRDECSFNKRLGLRTLAYIQQDDVPSKTPSTNVSSKVSEETKETLVRLGVECFDTVDELLFNLQNKDSSREWWKEYGETLEDTQLFFDGNLCKEPCPTNKNDFPAFKSFNLPTFEQLFSLCFTPTIRARSWVLPDNGLKPPSQILFPSSGFFYFVLFIFVSIGLLTFTITEFIRFRGNFSTPGLLQRAFCTFQLPVWTRLFLNIPAGLIIGWSGLGPYNGGLPPAQVDFPWYPFAAQMGVLLFSYVALIVILVDRFFRLANLYWESPYSYDQCLHPLYVIADANNRPPKEEETCIDWSPKKTVSVGNPLNLAIPMCAKSTISPTFKIGFALSADYKKDEFFNVLENTIKLLSFISSSLVSFDENDKFDLLVLLLTDKDEEDSLNYISSGGAFEKVTKGHRTARHVIVRPSGVSSYLHLEYMDREKKVLRDDVARLLLSTISSKVPGAFSSKDKRVKIPSNFKIFPK